MNTGPRARLRRLAQRAVPLVGRATLGSRPLPGALLIGAQRAGTTSLHRSLAAHPQLAPPVLHKGVHYFDTSYGHSLAWYRAHFPRGGATTYETCPYYLAHPAVPGRVATDLPEARVLEQWDGDAVVLPYLQGRSTSGLVRSALAGSRGSA